MVDEIRSRTPNATWTVVVLGTLLIAPRVELLAIGSTALRLEDLMLAVLAVQVLGSRTQLVNGPMLAIVMAGLLSTSVGVLFGRIDALNGVLFALRPLEYWVIFPWVLHRVQRPRERALTVGILAVATVVQVSIATAQTMFHIQIGYSKFSLDRAAGWTAGPYELGAICSMLALFWLSRHRLLLTSVAVMGLLLTASRSSLLGAVVGVIPLARAVVRPTVIIKPAVVLAAAGLGCTALLVYVQQPAVPSTESGLTRIQEGGVAEAWERAQRTPSAHVPYDASAKYQSAAYGALDPSQLSSGASDASAVIRFTRWQMLASSQMASVDTWVWGLGPSFAGPSVDGGLLRVLFETGLLGLIGWTWWFSREWRLGPPASQAILLTLLTSAAFIDIQIAMRVMMYALVLLAIGRTVRDTPE